MLAEGSSHANRRRVAGRRMSELSGFRFFVAAVFAVFAAYFTFELFPVLYGKRWVPFLILVAYISLFESGVAAVRKFLGHSDKNSN
jgi:hypothetical protein